MRGRISAKGRPRVLLLRSPARSDWFSMNRIHRQWENAYRAAFPRSCSAVAVSRTRPLPARALESAGRLVLLDHQLDYPLLLEALSASGARPALSVHLFSDFLTRPAQRAAARELRGKFGAVFFAASRWLRDEALRELPGADVRVVPFPVADEFFETPLGAPAKEPPRWAYAGRIHPDKGVDQLLAHLLRSAGPPLRFQLLGWWCENRFQSWWEGPEDFERRRGELRSLVGALRLAPRWVKTERGVAKAFEGIDAFVFPSIFKGEEFGYALAQALAAGKLCWASDWRGHRDFSGCPGIRMIPVLQSPGAVPTLDFGAAPLSGAPASTALRRAIRAWASARHSVAAVAAKLKEAARSAGEPPR